MMVGNGPLFPAEEFGLIPFGKGIFGHRCVGQLVIEFGDGEVHDRWKGLKKFEMFEGFSVP
jgi:hypothetical protein